MIEVRNLTKTYGPTIAVDNISFDAKEGEVVGFIGPNGAGKTTAMRVLTCYIGADSGTATVAGYDVFQQPLEVRRHIGYLPESAPLYTSMGVLESLNFIAKARGILKGEHKSRIRDMIDICGLEEVVQKDVNELSKGYRQRLGLAQTLIHDPEVLILDEPTSGLDPIQIIQIRKLIKEIGEKKTIILSTHILSIVEETCNRVMIISRGKLVADGTQEKLIMQVQGGNIYTFRIRGPLEEIESKLKMLSFIKNVENITQDNGVCSFRVKSDEGTNIEEELFQFAADNEWSLTELRRESMNLEDVFLHFTLPSSEEA
ncbi:ATP-binding cassette domain-containing protein [bacterium]|nr:ATP-binding cassette domain-containing protein [bacterium]